MLLLNTADWKRFAERVQRLNSSSRIRYRNWVRNVCEGS
jgi:hypothetical protein